MARPLVSVIIPARDAARTLEATLKSLSSQTVADFEALIVNDGSRDATAHIAQGYATADPRFVSLDSEGEGVSAARNTALASSTGAFVAFLDADDVLPPDSLAVRASWMRENLGARLVSCMWDVIGPNGELLAPDMGKLPGPRRFDTAFEFPVHIGAVMGVGSLVRQFRFDPARDHGEDHEFLIDVTRSGVTLHPCHKVVLHYRWRADSAVSAHAERHCDALIGLWDQYLGPAALGVQRADEFAQGWSEDSVRPRQLALLRELAVHQALHGDADGVERALRRCTALDAWGASERAQLDADSLWLVAARAHLKPVRSAELGERVCGAVAALLALADRVREQPRFAGAVRGFVDQALAAAGELAA